MHVINSLRESSRCPFMQKKEKWKRWFFFHCRNGWDPSTGWEGKWSASLEGTNHSQVHFTLKSERRREKNEEDQAEEVVGGDSGYTLRLCKHREKNQNESDRITIYKQQPYSLGVKQRESERDRERLRHRHKTQGLSLRLLSYVLGKGAFWGLLTQTWLFGLLYCYY